MCDIFNYADDNSLYCEGNDYESAYQNVLQNANVMLKWLKDNYLQANPSKFQCIVFEKANISRSLMLIDSELMSEK